MSADINEKRMLKAKKFITGAKKSFKNLIPRDTINDVTITECVENDGDFSITGSVGTESPTGKQKTFKYSAVVKMDADMKCSLEDLKVSEL